ncbi:MAG: NAD(P)H-dependent glycerol-3-phosphate dehydrogenase [Clostridia bacterium]|nr:NAD(P)H-dependent glycerol-3-phosphate dehydrogenase [Clostridia bacterium]
MTKVTVLGSGGWGTAIALLLASKGNYVKLWSFLEEETKELIACRENKRYLPGIKIPENVEFLSNMEKAVKDTEIIVSAVPSKGVSSTSAALAKHINVKKQILVSVSKGLDADTHKRLSEIIKENIPGVRLAILSGPSHAEEVARKMATTNVVAADEKKVAEKIQDLFMCDFFRVYISDDMAGVEYGGALKNVIALSAGIADGLGLGDNAKAALMTRGMTEIARLGVKMGAKTETFFGLSGMGDLIVTCTSMHSRNRRAGVLIGQGKTTDEAIKEVKMVVEGVPAALAGYKLAKKAKVDMPITTEVYKILFENKPVKDAVRRLMTRQKKHETEDTLI